MSYYVVLHKGTYAHTAISYVDIVHDSSNGRPKPFLTEFLSAAEKKRKEMAEMFPDGEYTVYRLEGV